MFKGILHVKTRMIIDESLHVLYVLKSC
jgi:hypothetical protein